MRLLISSTLPIMVSDIWLNRFCWRRIVTPIHPMRDHADRWVHPVTVNMGNGRVKVGEVTT